MFKWLVLILGLWSSNLFAIQKVVLYVYHLKAPYILDVAEQTGLYFDVSSIFNRYQDEVTFSTYFLPRKRLDKLVESGLLDGLVLGVNPLWFNDTKKESFLWSESIFEDVDDFVSFHQRPFEYENTNSLENKSLGGILGYHYFGVDELVEQSKLTRVNTNEEHHLLDMLIKHRLDIAIVSRSTREYLEHKNHWGGLFHVSEVPHDRYTRHIMGTKSQPVAMEIVNRLLSQPAVKEALQLREAYYKSAVH